MKHAEITLLLSPPFGDALGPCFWVVLGTFRQLILLGICQLVFL